MAEPDDHGNTAIPVTEVQDGDPYTDLWWAGRSAGCTNCTSPSFWRNAVIDVTPVQYASKCSIAARRLAGLRRTEVGIDATGAATSCGGGRRGFIERLHGERDRRAAMPALSPAAGL